VNRRAIFVTAALVLVGACSSLHAVVIVWNPQFTQEDVGVTASSKAVCLGTAVTLTPSMTDEDTLKSRDLNTPVFDDTCWVDWDFGDGNALNHQPIQPVDYTYQEKGTYTVTATFHDNDTGNSRDDPADQQVTTTVTAFKVVKVEHVSGGTPIGDGAATPADTDVCAAVKATGYVVVQAVTDPAVAAADLPDCFTWAGGEEVAGNRLQRKASKSAWAKHELTADCCQVAGNHAHMIAYVIGASKGGYSPANGTAGAHFADNEKGFASTGIFGPDPGTGEFYSQCEIEFDVEPAVLVTDANNNLFDKDHFKWDVSREKRVKMWVHTGGAWSLLQNDSATWLSDDVLGHGEEDLNPWNGNGHLYGNDRPGATPAPADDGLVRKLNMREFVKVDLGPGATTGSGPICSVYHPWHVFRAVKETAGVWASDPAYENEIPPGNIFWGIEPTAGLEITTTSLPNCPKGGAYSQTLSSVGGTAPISWSLDSGSLPPDLALSGGGTISGTATTAGVWSFDVEAQDSSATPLADIQPLSITVVEPVQITTSSPLPGGTLGVQYAQQLASTGGTAPVTWSKTSGELPPGLSLSASGSVSGTPTALGTYNFTVKAEDSSAPKSSDTKPFSITVEDIP